MILPFISYEENEINDIIKRFSLFLLLLFFISNDCNKFWKNMIYNRRLILGEKKQRQFHYLWENWIEQFPLEKPRKFNLKFQHQIAIYEKNKSIINKFSRKTIKKSFLLLMLILKHAFKMYNIFHVNINNCKTKHIFNKLFSCLLCTWYHTINFPWFSKFF